MKWGHALIGLSDIHRHGAPRKDRIRVACVGDSITYGALIPLGHFFSYPAQLGRRLGKAYQVENFGLNGRCVRKGADRPYSAEEEFRKSLAFEPDIVILMLGTNDTKPHNWQGIEPLEQDYRELIAVYRQRSRVILCTPTWGVNAHDRFRQYTNNTDADLLPDIAACVRRLAASEGLPLADLHQAFMNRRELISYDGIHPNRRGAGEIAARIAEVIGNV